MIIHLAKMRQIFLTIVCALTIFSANAKDQVCGRACWIGPGKIIGASYAWLQPADVPCSPNIAWLGAKVYFIEAYEDHGKIVVLDSGWTDENGMEC